MSEMVDALDPREGDRTIMSVPFDERAGMVAGHAWEAKRASSARRLTQRARLRFPDAEPGEMTCDGRGIDGVLIREAMACQFMSRAANVVIEGCTGTGKSYLACCIAKQACRMCRSARHVRLPDLLMERDELAATERSDANAYCSFFGVTFRSPSVYRSISHRCVLACGTGADGAHDRVHTGDFAVLGLT